MMKRYAEISTVVQVRPYYGAFAVSHHIAPKIRRKVNEKKV